MLYEILYYKVADFYKIDEYGNIMNINTGKYRKPSIDKYGYMNIILSDKFGKKHNHKVHRLVMMTFAPMINYHVYHVNHIDCNKLNNHISNLEWATPKENIHHAMRHNLLRTRELPYDNDLKDFYRDLIKSGYTTADILDLIGCRERSHPSYNKVKSLMNRLKRDME